MPPKKRRAGIRPASVFPLNFAGKGVTSARALAEPIAGLHRILPAHILHRPQIAAGFSRKQREASLAETPDLGITAGLKIRQLRVQLPPPAFCWQRLPPGHHPPLRLGNRRLPQPLPTRRGCAVSTRKVWGANQASGGLGLCRARRLPIPARTIEFVPLSAGWGGGGGWSARWSQSGGPPSGPRPPPSPVGAEALGDAVLVRGAGSPTSQRWGSGATPSSGRAAAGREKRERTAPERA